MIVLVDIPGLLAANVGRFNDMDVILQHVLSATIKETDMTNTLKGFVKDIMNSVMPSSIRMGQLKSIAFVANKADMINYNEIDTLNQLLQEFVKTKIKNYPHIKHMYFVCSAIRSTEMRGEDLLGYSFYDTAGNSTRPPHPTDLMSRLSPSPLPESWPDFWSIGEYYYPEVWPTVPHKKVTPPNQNGLEEILQFIFEEQ